MFHHSTETKSESEVGCGCVPYSLKDAADGSTGSTTIVPSIFINSVGWVFLFNKPGFESERQSCARGSNLQDHCNIPTTSRTRSRLSASHCCSCSSSPKQDSNLKHHYLKVSTIRFTPSSTGLRSLSDTRSIRRRHAADTLAADWSPCDLGSNASGTCNPRQTTRKCRHR